MRPLSPVQRDIDLWRSGCGYYQQENDEDLEVMINGLLEKMRERCAEKVGEVENWSMPAFKSACLNARLK